MAPRPPLPRGPVTFAEEQTAQLIGEVKKTNRLLGHVLAQLKKAAPGPAAVTEGLAAIREVPAVPHGALVHLQQFDPVSNDPERHQHNLQAHAPPAGAPPPDSEVKSHDGSGSAPAKRPGRGR